MDLIKIFGENVRYYRKRKDLTQQKLGDLTGLHRTYIGKIERGEKKLIIENVDIIARSLQVNPAILLRKIKDW